VQCKPVWNSETYRMGQKNALFCIYSQTCVLKFLLYFSGGVDSRLLFWRQYG